MLIGKLRTWFIKDFDPSCRLTICGTQANTTRPEVELRIELTDDQAVKLVRHILSCDGMAGVDFGPGVQRISKLDELLERARHHQMTPEEIREQRVSWVYGQLRDTDRSVTKDDVRRRLRQLEGESDGT